jgi:hypothetical protein
MANSQSESLLWELSVEGWCFLVLRDSQRPVQSFLGVNYGRKAIKSTT